MKRRRILKFYQHCSSPLRENPAYWSQILDCAPPPTYTHRHIETRQNVRTSIHCQDPNKNDNKLRVRVVVMRICQNIEHINDKYKNKRNTRVFISSACPFIYIVRTQKLEEKKKKKTPPVPIPLRIVFCFKNEKKMENKNKNPYSALRHIL